MVKVKIADTSAYLPAHIVTNSEIEYRLNTPQYEWANSGSEAIKTAKMLPSGALERLFGSRERRFAAKNEQVSDIATRAALPIV